VDDDWLRFDFTNLSPVESAQLSSIVSDVAERIAAAEAIQWQTLPLSEARTLGAMMLFGEKYPDPVRMVSMGGFSKELCGGTHLANTREVQNFEVLSEEGVSAGTRRIVALTGKKATEYREEVQTQLNKAAKLLGVEPFDVPTAVEGLIEKRRELKRALDAGVKPNEEKSKLASKGSPKKGSAEGAKTALSEAARRLSVSLLGVVERIEAMQAEVASLAQRLAQRDAAGPVSADALLEKARDQAGVKVVLAEVPGVEPNLMRQLIDQIRQKAPLSAVLLATRQGEDKVTLVAGISKQLQDRGVSAGKWISPVAKAVGGGGGGRPDLAQAGGKDPAKLPEALQVAERTLAAMLGA
jgi:alanyl-tRNA synthetase